MKKSVIAVSLLISMGLSPMSFGEGIPTFDVVQMQKSMEMINEARNQLKELQEQVATAKSQLKAFEEEARLLKGDPTQLLDNIFDSSTAYLNNALEDSQKAVSEREVDDYLKSKGITAEDGTELKADYERKIQQIKRMESLQSNIESRAKRMEKLQAKFNNTELQKEREQIIAQIQIENVNMQNTMKAVELEMKKQEQENKIIESEALKASMDNEFKKPKIKGYFDIR
ncbi:type IV secretion system protein [Proteus mirabilis]|uniref:type IV secretion system protein n=2 Tax=Morganellaceae TaxID=1903414 RepID=UPI0034E49D15